jgi:hypothetical protein
MSAFLEANNLQTFSNFSTASLAIHAMTWFVNYPKVL